MFICSKVKANDIIRLNRSIISKDPYLRDTVWLHFCDKLTTLSKISQDDNKLFLQETLKYFKEY